MKGGVCKKRLLSEKTKRVFRCFRKKPSEFPATFGKNQASFPRSEIFFVFLHEKQSKRAAFAHGKYDTNLFRLPPVENPYKEQHPRQRRGLNLWFNCFTPKRKPPADTASGSISAIPVLSFTPHPSSDTLLRQI